MSYLALYRKWRPQTFAELVGQDHVAQTLMNAIAHARLAHAYLFCGPRGTGKTTSARLLAKALNCKAGPTPQPCGTCTNCQEIAAGTSLDVIEIDAASNRGVGEMRDLLGRVHHAAVTGGHRIYIIDEVHMLTAEAFNTLLKTLEEPPPKLIFILATTEVQKVLPTIVSRCQRLDFRRIPTGIMVRHLQRIAAAEEILITAPSLQAIARRAEGGLRDAISLLDQVSSLGRDNREVSADLVLHLLGMVRTDQLVAIGQAVADRQVYTALERVRSLLESGYDYASVLRELLEHFRNLLLTRLAPQAALAEFPEEDRPLMEEQSRGFEPDELYLLMDVLRETEGMVRGTTQPQIWLEIGIMRLCLRQSSDLAARIAQLERQVERLAQEAASGVRRPASGGQVAEGEGQTIATRIVPESQAPPSEAPIPGLPATKISPAPAPLAAAPAPSTAPSRPRSVIPFLAPSLGPESKEQPPAPAEAVLLASDPASTTVSDLPSSAPRPPDAGRRTPDADKWDEVLQVLKDHQPVIFGQVADSHLLAADEPARQLMVALPNQFLKDQLDKGPKRRKILNDVVAGVFGGTYTVRFEVRLPDLAEGGAPLSPEVKASSSPTAGAGRKAEEESDTAKAQLTNTAPTSVVAPHPSPAPPSGSFAQEIAEITRGRIVEFPWPGNQ